MFKTVLKFFNFYVHFFLLSGWLDYVDGARLLMAQEVARVLYIDMMDYTSRTAGCLKKRIMFARCMS
jgi:hypothetical protein